MYRLHPDEDTPENRRALECLDRARAEGRDVLRALMRDGHVTPAEVEAHQTTPPSWWFAE